jgi:hypothetical protein
MGDQVESFDFDCPSHLINIADELAHSHVVSDVDPDWWTTMHDLALPLGSEGPAAGPAGDGYGGPGITASASAPMARRNISPHSNLVVAGRVKAGSVTATTATATAPSRTTKAAVAAAITGTASRRQIPQKQPPVQSLLSQQLEVKKTRVTVTSAAVSKQVVADHVSSSSDVSSKRSLSAERRAPEESTGAVHPTSAVSEHISNLRRKSREGIKTEDHVNNDSKKRKSKSPQPADVKAARSTSSSNGISSSRSIMTRPQTAITTKSSSSSHAGLKAVAQKTSSVSKSASYQQDTDDMMALLRKHNQKFAPKPTYVPAKHGVRDVRAWEVATGKMWAKLSPEEREQANAEIDVMKASSSTSTK